MSQMRRVRITSDGTAEGTRAIDLESGSVLPTVSLAWELAGYGYEDMPLAMLKVVHSEIDVETGARIYTVCPKCGDEDWTKEVDDLRDELACEKQLRLDAEDRLRDAMGELDSAITEVVSLRAAERRTKATFGGLVAMLGLRGGRG